MPLIDMPLEQLKKYRPAFIHPCTGHEETDDWRERLFTFMTRGLRDKR